MLQFVDGRNQSDFAKDALLQSAVLHQLSIIGEAAKGVSGAITAKYPEVEWRAICDFRNQVVHAYFSLDLDIVWETVRADLPQLRHQILQILESEFPHSGQKDI